jgi:predicted transcriptional regulator
MPTSSRKSHPPYVIAQKEQLAAVRSPVRQELLHHMATIGPCSVSELAAKMDRPADALYYHVKALMRVGLLHQQGKRKATRRDEAVYSLPEKRIRFEFDPKSESSRNALIGAVAASLRLTERDFAHALEHEVVTTTGPQQDIRSRRYRTWLDKKAVVKVNKLLNELDKLLLDEDRLRKGRPYAVTYVVTPVKVNSKV